MKAMSIVGIVWFSISFSCLVWLLNTDAFAAAGWGLFGIFYAIPYSIVGLVLSSKKSNAGIYDVTSELVKLGELKEKGILTEEEFNDRKHILLSLH